MLPEARSSRATMLLFSLWHQSQTKSTNQLLGSLNLWEKERTSSDWEREKNAVRRERVQIESLSSVAGIWSTSWLTAIIIKIAVFRSTTFHYLIVVRRRGVAKRAAWIRICHFWFTKLCVSFRRTATIFGTKKLWSAVLHRSDNQTVLDHCSRATWAARATGSIYSRAYPRLFVVSCWAPS